MPDDSKRLDSPLRLFVVAVPVIGSICAGHYPSQSASLPCPQACSARGSSRWGTPLWLAVTGRIRREMRVHLPYVGAYLGLSWGTNSKDSLCSSRSEGTGSHLSTLSITDNKGGKHCTRTSKLEDYPLRKYQKLWGVKSVFCVRSVL